MTEREKLIDLFYKWQDENHCQTCTDVDCGSCYEDSENGLFKFFIEHGVTIPVRCGECKYHDDKEDIGWCKIHSQLLESGNWTIFGADDYCSYGERRADNADN